MKNTIIKVLSVVMAMVMIMGSVLVMSASAADECKHENYEQYGDPVPATCTEWGFTLYQCSDCKNDFKAEFNTLEKPHSQMEGYELTKIAEVKGTCIADAYTVSACSICGEEVTTVTPNSKGDHAWSEWTTVESDCTTAGNKTRTCSVCAKVETVAIDEKGHEWIALEDQVVEPKCTAYVDPNAPDNDKAAYGSMPYKCKNCDATRTVEIAPRGHRYVAMEKSTSGLCGTVDLPVAGKYCEWCYLGEDGIAHKVIEHTLPDTPENACATGVTTVICTTCKASVEIKVEHEFKTTPTASKAPTCSKYGYELFGCAHCGTKFNNVVYNPLGCDFSGEPTPIDATCTEAGGLKYTCQRENCDAGKNGEANYKIEANPEAPAKGHSATLTEVAAKAPTCTEDGYTAGKLCPDCNTYVEGHAKVAKLGHANVTYICTEEAKKDIICSRCNEFATVKDAEGNDVKAEKLDVTVIEGSVESHVWVKQDDSIPAGCTTSGIDVLLCKYCAKPSTKTVPALGHKTKTETVAATCIAAGYTLVTCERADCLATISNTVLPIDPNGHIGEVTTYKAPTCTADGIEIGACVNCNKLYEKVLAKLGHDVVNVEAKAPTCTEAGNTAGSSCKRCEEVFVKSETLAALGHKEETVAGYAATCTTKGLKDGKKCKVCGTVTVAQVEIPAIDHYTAGVQYPELITKTASCKDAGQIGYVTHECDYCDEAYIDAYYDIPAHSMEATWTKLEATCENDGYEYRLCTACGLKEIKADSTVKATGHKNAAGTVFATACSYAEGFDTKCTNANCDYKATGSVVPVTHQFVVDTQVVDLCLGQYYDLQVCTACGFKKVTDVYTAAPQHDYKAIEAPTGNPTPDKALKFVDECKRCGYVNTYYKAIPTVMTKAEIKNLSNPGYNVVQGTKRVQVVISIRGDKVGFHNFAAKFTYDKNTLEYVDIKVAKNISGVELTAATYKAEDGVINISTFVTNGADGKPQNVELTADWQEFIVVEFKVVADAIKNNTITTVNGTDKGVFTSVALGSLVSGANDPSTYFNNVEGTKMFIGLPTADTLKTAIYVLGDANKDGVISAADLLALQTLILNGEYAAEADLDGNGKVEAKDLSNLQKLIVGSYTYKQLADGRK